MFAIPYSSNTSFSFVVETQSHTSTFIFFANFAIFQRHIIKEIKEKILQPLLVGRVHDGGAPGNPHHLPDIYQEVEWFRNEPDSDHPENWGWFETDVIPTPTTGFEFSMIWKNRGMNTGVRWSLAPTYDTFATAIGTWNSSTTETRSMNFLYGRYSSNYVKTLTKKFREDTEYNHHMSLINKHYKVVDNTDNTVVEEGNLIKKIDSSVIVY